MRPRLNEDSRKVVAHFPTSDRAPSQPHSSVAFKKPSEESAVTFWGSRARHVQHVRQAEHRGQRAWPGVDILALTFTRRHFRERRSCVRADNVSHDVLKLGVRKEV